MKCNKRHKMKQITPNTQPELLFLGAESRRHVHNLGKPLLQRSSQHRGQLFHVTDNEVVREGEVIKIALHLKLHLTTRSRIGLKVGLREIEDRATLNSINDDKHNHNALLKRLSDKTTNSIMIFTDTIRDNELKLPEISRAGTR